MPVGVAEDVHPPQQHSTSAPGSGPQHAGVPPHGGHPAFPIRLRFLDELKRRNVIRVAILYLIACWVILEPTHVVFHMLEVPAWVNRLVVVLMAAGLPVVVVLAWVYEITPEGLKPAAEVPHGQSTRKLTGRRLDRAIIAALGLALAYFVADKFWISKHLAVSQPVASAPSEPRAIPSTEPAFAPPPHSIAVLPFVNMSGDKEQDYFSDGLSEELLNSLARINELQVAARTSSFYFKGEHADLSTIAHKLNVASVLEGSVRRSGNTIRITAQLNNAVTGFHLWSQTYDRNLGDVLKLQTEIANAVASALKITLLGDVAAKIEVGGTRNPAAFDAYLRASNAYRRYGPMNLAAGAFNEQGLQPAIAAYTEAIRADPDYALAYAGRSLAFADFARALVTGPDVPEYFNKAQADARKAIALAPDLADGHLALANFFAGSLEFTGATQEYERALALAPGNARLLKEYGAFADLIGRTEAGLVAAHRLLVLDPLNSTNHFGLGVSLTFARRYGEAITAFTDTRALAPEDVSVNMWLGIAYYLSGDFHSARAACERAGEVNGPWCLAMVYDKLGRRAEAQTMLAKVRASAGDRLAEGYADIYAQWGDSARALDWLEAAMRNRDPYLAYTKINPFFDPLRKEPRFQAIERALKFPD